MQHTSSLLPVETTVVEAESGTAETSGAEVAATPGYSRVEFVTNSAMAAPGSQFVRGGVVFGVADHAAMLALAQPGAVLQAAEVQFIRPVKVDEHLVAEAHARIRHGKKRHVTVTVSQGAEKVLEGEFTACLPA